MPNLFRTSTSFLVVLFLLGALLLQPLPIAANRPPVLQLQAAAASEWPMRHHDALMRAASPELILPPLSPLWTNTYPPGDLADRPPLPIAADGKLFVIFRGGDQTKSLLALDPETGQELWSKGFLNGHNFTEVAYDEATKRLYAATPLDLVVLNPDTGDVLRQTALPSGGSFFSVSNGDLYVSTTNLLTKYDADGNLIWQYKDSRPVNPHAAVSVGNGMVYMASGYWTLQGFNARTGKKIWESPTNGNPYTPPVIGDGLVFQGMQGQGAESITVAAFDAYTGKIKWGVRTGFGGTVWTAMSYANGVLYFGSDDQNVYAIDTKTPKVLWQYETANDIESPVVVIGNIVYAVAECTWIPAINDLGGYLYALDAATGSLLMQETVPCSGGGLIPYQGKLIINSRMWDNGHVLRAYRTQPGFRLSLTPNKINLRLGTDVQTQLNISATYNYSETIQLTTSPLPNGISVYFPEILPGATIPFTVSASPDVTLQGTFPITLTAASASYQSSTVLNVKIVAGPPLTKRVYLPLLVR